MLRALWKALRAAWSRYRHHDEWELIGSYWHGPKGERLKAISGGQWEGEGDSPDVGGLFGLATDALGSEGGGAAPAIDIAAPSLTFGAGGPTVSAVTDVAKSGGGFTDWIKNLGSSLGKEFTDAPLKSFATALGLGGSVLGAANQFNVQNQIGKQTGIIQQGQKQAQAAAAPAVQFGTTTLNAAAGGNLPGPLQAQIDQWKDQAKADARSRLASLGLGNSQDINQMDQLIDQQAEAMKGSLLQQQEETGLAGLQTGVSAATGVMGVAAQQQAQLTALINQANQALGQIAGRTA